MLYLFQDWLKGYNTFSATEKRNPSDQNIKGHCRATLEHLPCQLTNISRMYRRVECWQLRVSFKFDKTNLLKRLGTNSEH